MPEEAARKVDSVWRYHKYHGYGGAIDAYGRPTDVRGFAERAQLVNYDQYRALMEGHLAHMWEWYTGVIIWKTQNPWTALRGQMYDCYLDPNGGLYGLRSANEPLHVMCSPGDGMLWVVNSGFRPRHDLMLQARTLDIAGKDSLIFQWIVEVGASTAQRIDTLTVALRRAFAREGGFLDLRLLDASRRALSRNLYWYPDSADQYTGLRRMPMAGVQATAHRAADGRVEVRIENPAGGPLAFFLRVSLIDVATNKRILPVMYSDNYLSVSPGEHRTVLMEYPPGMLPDGARVSVRGWNVRELQLTIE
jgi:hypothetical protein